MLADIIRNGGQWDGQEAIRLVSCETGSGPFSQELANLLGVDVMAPVREVWSSNSGKNLMEGLKRKAELVIRHPE